MTVSTTETRAQYSGNDLTVEFAFPYLFLDQGHLVVILTDTDGVDTVQTITTHYTVAGAGSPSGGTVTMLTAPATGELLTIYRDSGLLQATDLSNQGAYFLEDLEDALDKLTLMIQEIVEGLSRTVQSSIVEGEDGLTAETIEDYIQTYIDNNIIDLITASGILDSYQLLSEKDANSGYAGLSAAGDVLAPGYGIQLTRDGGNSFYIMERTSGEYAIYGNRQGTDDYILFVRTGSGDGAVWHHLNHNASGDPHGQYQLEASMSVYQLIASMSDYQLISGKGAASGYVGLDASSHILAPGGAIRFTRDGFDNVIFYEQTSGEDFWAMLRVGTNDYDISIRQSTGWSQILTLYDHVTAAADPHTQYQLEASMSSYQLTSEKDQPNGYAKLNTGTGDLSAPGSTIYMHSDGYDVYIGNRYASALMLKLVSASGTNAQAFVLENSDWRQILTDYNHVSQSDPHTQYQLESGMSAYQPVASMSDYQLISGKNAANGYVGINSAGDIEAPPGYILNLTRNSTTGYIALRDATSGDWPAYWHYDGAVDWSMYINSGGGAKTVQHSGMKSVANGIVGIDGNGDASIPGQAVLITPHATNKTFGFYNSAASEWGIQGHRTGTNDYEIVVYDGGSPYNVLHTGNKDVANGVVALSGNSIVGPGESLLLTRDGSNNIYIHDRTSGEIQVYFKREGTNDCTAYIRDGGVDYAMEHTGHKGAASGYAGLTAAQMVISPGAGFLTGADGSGDSIWYDYTTSEQKLYTHRDGTNDYVMYLKDGGSWATVLTNVNSGLFPTWVTTPASDHTNIGYIIGTNNAGATTAIGDLLYLNSSQQWVLADADAESTSKGLLGIAMNASTSGNPQYAALPGAIVRDDTWAWTPGATLYISTTAGGITETAPSGTGDVIRTIGYAMNADTIFFMPGGSWVVHA